MSNDKLYSRVPEERLEAGLLMTDEAKCQQISDLRQYVWFGSANAWVVFLGSSPGNSDPNGKKPSDYKSEISFQKPSNHLLKFNGDKGDKKGFWNKIKQYREIILPNLSDEDACRMMLAGNLVINEMSGQSSDLNKMALDEGAIKTFEVLSIVKPKLVICLEKTVYERIYRHALKNGHDQNVKQPITLTVQEKFKPPVNFLYSSNDWGKWVLTRVPMHPSRHWCNPKNFKEEYLERLNQLTREYLL